MSILDRTGAAPISWGICEVPDWGLQLPADRVLTEMHQLGFRTTELGSIGYLPADPVELRDTLEAHHLSLSGGFVPLVLHDPQRAEETIKSAERLASLLAVAGALHFVTCAVSDVDDWQRPPLAAAAWEHVNSMLTQIDDLCTRHGLVQAFHPHVNSLVETSEEVQRLLDQTDVSFTLDTGHLKIGAFDPLKFAQHHMDRVALVHLKDLRSEVATQLNAGELTLMEAVQAGLFPPLGQGDLPMAEIIEALESGGYAGPYVIEQDVALPDVEPAAGDGPIHAVRASVAYLRGLSAP